MSAYRKLITGALAAATIAGGVLAASAPAEAQWRGRGAHHYRGGGWGGPGIAAGVVGGLALGAIAAPRYYGHGYGAGYGYAPAYAASPYHCYNQRRPAYDPWGNFAGYRLVRVCR